jgi:hypothetical protein
MRSFCSGEIVGSDAVGLPWLGARWRDGGIYGAFGRLLFNEVLE